MLDWIVRKYRNARSYLYYAQANAFKVGPVLLVRERRIAGLVGYLAFIVPLLFIAASPPPLLPVVAVLLIGLGAALGLTAWQLALWRYFVNSGRSFTLESLVVH